MSRKKPRPDIETIALWLAIGALVYRIGGKEFFIAWLIPGVPPPGPFG